MQKARVLLRFGISYDLHFSISSDADSPWNPAPQPPAHRLHAPRYTQHGAHYVAITHNVPEPATLMLLAPTLHWSGSRT